MWNSIEFVLLTKHEIIVDEFCNGLAKLREEIKASDDPEFGEKAWRTVVEFLSLSYSAGAVSVGVKEKLINALKKEAAAKSNRKKPSDLILKALLITLKSTSMQNYYKSKTDDYARFVATCLRYLTVIIRSESDLLTDKSKSSEVREHFESVLNALKGFIKQTPFLDSFKVDFTKEILNVLCEIVILMKSFGIDYYSDLFTLLQELFFDDSRANVLKAFLKDPSVESNEYHLVFDAPVHVLIIIVETILISYRHDSDVQKHFINYLLNDEVGKFRCISAECDDRMLLRSVSLFMQLVRKHDVPLTFEIEGAKCISHLGKRIENIVNEHHSNHILETLSLVCATLKLNPLILEHSACQIAVKFMIVAKTEESVWRKYEELMSSLIEMYRKLSRAEKFIPQLLRHLNETLSTVKLSKKLKRSFNASFTSESLESPTKRNKSSLTEESFSVSPRTGEEVDFLGIIYKNLCEADDAGSSGDEERNATSKWSDISFAFPPTLSRTYTRFISSLVSKPSLVVWKTLIFTLKDYVEQLSLAEGKSTENSMFLIEFSSALLSQYFAGSRLAEQADKTWKSIEDNRQLTFNVLGDFGRAILNQEHNHRTMNAFLKLCFDASNFDLLCWYYCPDSMNPLNESAQHSDLPKLDGAKGVKELHSFLSAKEWTIIEQRITNFGKRECKWNFNKIALQRSKANQLFGDSARLDVTKNLLSSSLQDAEQIYCILSEEVTANWFIENLNSRQKELICELLLRTPRDLGNLRKINFANREFIDILTISTYKSLIQILAEGKSGENLNKINWTALVSERQSAVPELARLMKDVLKSKRRCDEKLLETSHDDVLEYLSLLTYLPLGYSPREVKNIVFALNSVIQWTVSKSKNEEIRSKLIRIYKSKLFESSSDVHPTLKKHCFQTFSTSTIRRQFSSSSTLRRSLWCSVTSPSRTLCTT